MGIGPTAGARLPGRHFRPVRWIPGLGRIYPHSAANTLAAIYVSADILTDARTLDRLVVATLVNAWLMEQIIYNIFQVDFPGGSSRFFRMSDGTFLGDSWSVGSRLTREKDGGFLMTSVSGAEYRFNRSGRMSRLTDSRGRFLEFSYDPNGFLTSVSDNKGQTLTLTNDKTTSPRLPGTAGPSNTTTTTAIA